MSGKKYRMLMKKIKANDEITRLTIMNARIEEVIKNSPDKKLALEALICLFETRNNDASVLAIVSIAYATLLGGCSAIFSCVDTAIPAAIEFSLYIGFVLVLASIVLIGYCISKNVVVTRRTFVLQALKIYYDNKSYAESCAEAGGKEKAYHVSVKVKEMI